MRRTVCLTWRGLVQHFGLLQADGEAKVLGCIREAGAMCSRASSVRVAVVSKQQLSDELLDGFRAFEETPKVAETAVCSETDAGAVWQVVFCLTEHDAEDGEQCGGQNAPLLDAVRDGEAARQRPIMFHLTLRDLHAAGGGW